MPSRDTQLRLTVLRLARRIRAERADDSMSDTQMAVLSTLKTEGAKGLKELAEAERVTPPSMNRTVNALVETGYVSRTESVDDRRRVVIAITEEGLAMVAATRRKRDEWFARRVATLTGEQRRLLEQAEPILKELADK